MRRLALPSLPLLLLLLAGAAACLPAPARAGGGEPISPIHSAAVTTQLRTLRGLPFKGLITSAQGWTRVTRDLDGAPPAPAFAQGEVCLLVVVDESGGARSTVRRVERFTGGLRVRLDRIDGEVSVDPELKAFFLRFKAFKGGIELVHTTRLPELNGTIQKRFAADPSDLAVARLPQLGPDIRFSFKTFDGNVPEGLKLRCETRFGSAQRAAKLDTIDFPRGVAFPRIRRGTRERHIFAAYSGTHRSKNALLFSELPPPDGNGSPSPLRHEFQLELRPQGPKPPAKKP